MAENVFLSVKRNLHRLNLSRSMKDVSVNFLASSFLNKNIGLEKVAEGIRYYQEKMAEQSAPAKCFKDLSWLTKHEPVPGVGSKEVKNGEFETDLRRILVLLLRR